MSYGSDQIWTRNLASDTRNPHKLRIPGRTQLACAEALTVKLGWEAERGVRYEGQRAGWEEVDFVLLLIHVGNTVQGRVVVPYNATCSRQLAVPTNCWLTSLLGYRYLPCYFHLYTSHLTLSNWCFWTR